MAKKKTQIKKPSIAAILGMILLGLVAVGVVANVIKSNVKEKEEESTLEMEEVTITLQGSGFEVTFNYEEGMTWEEVAENNDNIEVKDGYITFYDENVGDFLYLISCDSPEDRTPVTPDTDVDLTLTYIYQTTLD